MLPKVVGTEDNRAYMAFGLAPLATSVILFIYIAFAHGFSGSPRTRDFWADAAAAFVLPTIFAYLAALVFGVPCFLLFRRLRLSSLMAHAVGGTLISVAAMLVLFLIGATQFLTQRIGLVSFASSLPVPILCGIVSSAVFWMLIRGGPGQRP